MASWITRLRARIGNELIFVNSAGGWIEDSSGRVLLQRRPPHSAIWGIPGGIMELGEAAHETAVREVREETGLDVVPVDLIGVYTKFIEALANGDQCQSVTFIFRMSIIGGVLVADGVGTFELRFFDRWNLPELYSKKHRLIAADVLSGMGPFFC